MAFAEGTPTVEVELAGKSRQLGFTLAAMRRAQVLGVLDVDTADEMAMMLALPAYVWACMDKDDRAELSFEDVDELINPHNLPAIRDKVGELFDASRPPDEVGNEQPLAVKEPTSGKKSISKNSGRSASTTSASRTADSGV